MTLKVQEALTEIFKAVADACDGGDLDRSSDIVAAYEDAMKVPEVQEFYGDLVDARSSEIFG